MRKTPKLFEGNVVYSGIDQQITNELMGMIVPGENKMVENYVPLIPLDSSNIGSTVIWTAKEGFKVGAEAPKKPNISFDEMIEAGQREKERLVPRQDDRAAKTHSRSGPNSLMTGAPVPVKGKIGDRPIPAAFDKKPGDTASWEASDFVAHYYFGGGAPIDLRWIGLGRKFENSPSVRHHIDKFIRNLLAKKTLIGDQKEVVVSDVTLEDGLFAVGNSSLFMEATSTESECLCHFYIRDSFKDPLDVGIEPGGIPYPILYDLYRAIDL